MLQPESAANDRMFIFIGLENNRRVACSRIPGGEDQRFRLVIGSPAEKNRAWPLPDRGLRAPQRSEGLFQRAGIRVTPVRRQIERLAKR